MDVTDQVPLPSETVPIPRGADEVTLFSPQPREVADSSEPLGPMSVDPQPATNKESVVSLAENLQVEPMDVTDQVHLPNETV